MNSQKPGFLVVIKIFDINEVVKYMKVYPTDYYVVMKNFKNFSKIFSC